MNQLHEFKARLLDKFFEEFDLFCSEIPETYRDDSKTLHRLYKLMEIWDDYHKLEAKLE